MEASLVRLVRRRAENRCEYCCIPQLLDAAPFEIDHVIALKHHGKTAVANLALSCFHCNSCKGSNIGGRDPITRKLTPLFHPRRNKWNRHFRWNGPVLVGRTPVGRVTTDVLRINDILRVHFRQLLIAEGCFP